MRITASMAKSKPSTKSLDPDLLGPCMLYCGYCGVYQNGKCEGCGSMTRKLEKRGKVFCGMRKCASRKGVTMCAECKDYPCKRFDEGAADDHALFSRELTEYLRDNSR